MSVTHRRGRTVPAGSDRSASYGHPSNSSAGNHSSTSIHRPPSSVGRTTRPCQPDAVRLQSSRRPGSRPWGSVTQQCLILAGSGPGAGGVCRGCVRAQRRAHPCAPSHRPWDMVSNVCSLAPSSEPRTPRGRNFTVIVTRYRDVAQRPCLLEGSSGTVPVHALHLAHISKHGGRALRATGGYAGGHGLRGLSAMTTPAGPRGDGIPAGRREPARRGVAADPAPRNPQRPPTTVSRRRPIARSPRFGQTASPQTMPARLGTPAGTGSVRRGPLGRAPEGKPSHPMALRRVRDSRRHATTSTRLRRSSDPASPSSTVRQRSTAPPRGPFRRSRGPRSAERPDRSWLLGLGVGGDPGVVHDAGFVADTTAPTLSHSVSPTPTRRPRRRGPVRTRLRHRVSS